MNSSRFIKSIATSLLIITGCLPSMVAAQAAPFTESNGVVFFEAEQGTPLQGAGFGDWAVSTELSNYSGNGYIEWTGPDLFDQSGAGRDVITYTFEVTNPGNYEMRWRTRIAHGESNTESNDSWVRFPTGVNVNGEQPMFGWTKVFMGHAGAWFWDAKIVDHTGANVRQYLAAGTHRLEVSGRSFGHAIDKMALYKYQELSLSPNDLDVRTGTPQSSIEGNQLDTNSPATNSSARVIENGLQYTPGECVDGVLALPAIADIHLLDGRIFNNTVLQVAPEPARALMRFDLSAVSGATAAELHVTIDGENGNGILNYYLAQQSGWSEFASGVNPAPENLSLLGSANVAWSEGTRYALNLPINELPLGELVIAIDAENIPQSMGLASRENSLQMPLLIISDSDSGSGGLCENYASAQGSVEPNETASQGESGNPAEGDVTTPSSQITDQTQELESDGANQPPSNGEASGNEGGSGGGAVSIWLILAGLFASVITRRRHSAALHLQAVSIKRSF